MNVTQTPVTNAANLSLFMVNVSYRLLGDFRQDNPHFSVLDLKAYYRGFKYVHETIKLLRQKPDPIVCPECYEDKQIEFDSGLRVK